VPAPAGNPVTRAWRTIQARRWSRWTFDAVVVLLVFWLVLAWQTRDLVGGGQPAPDFALRDLDGRVHRLSELRGRTVILDFWAPWCPVCAAQSGNVESAAGDDDVVLSIAVDYEDEATVRRFAEEHGIEAPVLLGDAAVRQAYHLSSYPTVYIVGADGRVEHGLVGYTTTLGLMLRLWF
jgi:peroxiredoxin